MRNGGEPRKKLGVLGLLGAGAEHLGRDAQPHQAIAQGVDQRVVYKRGGLLVLCEEHRAHSLHRGHADDVAHPAYRQVADK